MLKKESIAISCITAGTLLGGLTKLHFLAAIFFLAALALSISELVEVYKEYKQKKQQNMK